MRLLYRTALFTQLCLVTQVTRESLCHTVLPAVVSTSVPVFSVALKTQCGRQQSQRRLYLQDDMLHSMVRGRDRAFWVAQHDTWLPDLLQHSRGRAVNLSMFTQSLKGTKKPCCAIMLFVFCCTPKISVLKLTSPFCQYLFSCLLVLRKYLQEGEYLFCAQYQFEIEEKN